jgi:hypothetical protein
MKATYIAVVALGAAIMAAYLVYPAFATTTTPASTSLTTSNSASAASTPSTNTTPMPAPMQRAGGFFGGRGGGPPGGGGGPLGGRGGQGQAATFSNGQTITLTSTKGSYFVVGTQAKTNGTASGTLTFTVDGKVTGGYVLNIGGSLTVNGTTYNVTSGSAVMGPGGASIQGEGATSSSGSYIIRATARGDFSGTTTSTVSLDFSNGTTEYAVLLTSTIQG